ncbi:MAG: hypothetical protein WBA57_05260 [Elainellaceae cyanobacterium]
MKLANPLYYPVSVLIGAIALVVGVRLVQLPSLIAVPGSVAIATVGAAVQKGREPETLGLDNPALEQELLAVKARAEQVAIQAEGVQAEAIQRLTDIDELELLGVVQYACDRARELPAKIDQMARHMKGADSLLALSDLQSQLRDATAKREASSGIARQQWDKLTATLEHNIELAQEGRDTRQAQVVSLSTLTLEATGVLQQLQNKLRSADFSDAAQLGEVRSLSDEFTSVQDNLTLLVTHESKFESSP